MSTAFDRRQALAGAALAAVGVMGSATSRAASAKAVSGAARLDGIDVYYEIHGGPLGGKAVPLVLLPGGALTIEVGFTPELIERFARRRPVIAIEQQGHGHTADRPDRPIALGQMVSDAAGVLAQLGVVQADFLGHSLGGMVATGVAIRYPDLARNVTTVGSPFALEGFRADLVELQRNPEIVPSPDLASILPTEADFAEWRASFERAAPDPKAFDTILARLNTMLTEWPGWTKDELASIRAHMLVAVGDHDYVRVEHAAEVVRIIPKARLAVLPGTSHAGIVRRDAWLGPMMEALGEPEL